MKKSLTGILAASILLGSMSSFGSTMSNLKLDQSTKFELQNSLLEKSIVVENILRDPELGRSIDIETREELIQLSQDLMDASENPEAVRKPRKFKRIALGIVQGVGVGIHSTVLLLMSPVAATTEFVAALVIGESKSKVVRAAGDVARGVTFLADINLYMNFIPGVFQIAVITGFAMVPGKLICLNNPEGNQQFCGKIAKVDHVLEDQLMEKSTNAGVSLNKKIKKLYRKLFKRNAPVAE